jgi:hypothetical protein
MKRCWGEEPASRPNQSTANSKGTPFVEENGGKMQQLEK